MITHIDKNQNQFIEEDVVNVNNLFSRLQLILTDLKKDNINDLQNLIKKYEDINYVNFVIKNNLYENELNNILLHIQNFYKYKEKDDNTIILLMKLYNTFLKVKEIKKYKTNYLYVFFLLNTVALLTNSTCLIILVATTLSNL